MPGIQIQEWCTPVPGWVTEELWIAMPLTVRSSSELHSDTENSLEILSVAYLKANIVFRMNVVDYMNGKKLYNGRSRKDEGSIVT